RASTSTACTFIATSSVALKAPKTTRQHARTNGVGASTGNGSVRARPTAALTHTARLPSRFTSAPATGSAPRAPIAMNSKMAPSGPSPMPRRCFTIGMCGTHEARIAPFTKKSVETARRAAPARTSFLRRIGHRHRDTGCGERFCPSLHQDRTGAGRASLAHDPVRSVLTRQRAARNGFAPGWVMQIRDIQSDHYLIPLPVALSDSTHGTIHGFELVTVRVRDADGAEGVGYTYTVGTGGGAIHSLLTRELAPRLVGRDAERIEQLWQE